MSAGPHIKNTKCGCFGTGLIGDTPLLAIIGAVMQKKVRCPNCTQAHKITRGTQDYACRKCGTPIIVDGQFAARRDRTQERG